MTPPKGNTVPLKQFTPFPLTPGLVTTDLHSVSMDLPFLDISYTQNPTIGDLLCRASFTWISISCRETTPRDKTYGGGGPGSHLVVRLHPAAHTEEASGAGSVTRAA